MEWLKNLFRALPIQAIKGAKDVEIRGLTANSRHVAPGDLFLAKKGLTVDGSRFIPDAIAAGAVAVATDLYNPFLPITQVICDVAALEGMIAERFYGNPVQDLFLVGITGTNGKTTSAYLIHQLLGGGLIGTIGAKIGERHLPLNMTTPAKLELYKLFAEMRASHCSSCVMEVSSHALHQGRTLGIEFDVALFTNLTQDHLDYHKTMQHYLEAKSLLFSALQKGSKPFPKRAVINVDDPHALSLIRSCPAEILSYGIDTPCDLQAQEILLSAQGVQFTLCYKGEKVRFQSPLIGRYNVYNALGAIGVGIVHGLSLTEIASRLKNATGAPGRLEVVPNAKGVHVLIDYAHTEDALQSVLSTLQELKKGRLITVFGCGGNRDPYKRPKMGSVAEALSDCIIVTSDNPRKEDPHEIIRAILTGLSSPAHALVLPNRGEAIERALQMASPGDIVLIAGKGHEQEQIFADHTLPFDDRAVALSFS